MRRPRPARSDAAPDRPGYYGHPLVKRPVWTWQIPLYFFVGGAAGMSAVLALLAALFAPKTGADLAALSIAFGGSALSAALLTMDLGRPARFYMMLRVFKWRSPMSVGVWTLTSFGGFATLALLARVLQNRVPGIGRGLEVALSVPAAATGSLLTTYTAVLIGATAVPVWFKNREILPLHFAVAGLGSAAAALELVGFDLRALRGIGWGVGVAETLLAILFEARRRGAFDAPLHEGRSGFGLRAAALLAGPLVLVFRALEWSRVAAACFLVGALLSRYAWLWAGRAAADDPRAVLDAQPRA